MFSFCSILYVSGEASFSQLEETKTRRRLNTISSLQAEGVDSSFNMQNVWFETCSRAAINLFETLSHSPLCFRDKVHSDEKQDNDGHKEALMNTSGLVALDLIKVFCPVKNTQTERIIHGFSSLFTCFVFLEMYRGARGPKWFISSSDKFVIHAEISQERIPMNSN